MEKVSLAETLEKDIDSAVDYEITVAALLATALLIRPDVSQVLTVPTLGAALLLLLLTLLRRMALINPFSNKQWILSRTSPILVVTTTYSLLYLSLVVGVFLSAFVPVNHFYIAMFFFVVGALIAVIIYEILYRDFFLLMALHVWNIHLNSRGTPLSNWILEMSKMFLERSVLPEDEYPPQACRIRDTGLADTDEIGSGKRVGSYLGVVFGGVAFIGVFFLPMALAIFILPTPPDIQIIKIGILSLLFALSTNYSIVSTRFLYGRYGRDDFGELSSNKWRYIQYSLIVYLLFGAHYAYEQGFITSLN